jgi:hypothetical protein
MPNNQKLIDYLKRRHAFDIRQALYWWKQASEADKKLIWDEIQRMHGDPVQEVLSRFAQLGYTLVFLAAEDKGDAPQPSTH